MTFPMSSEMSQLISCGQLSVMISTLINEVPSVANSTAPEELLLTSLSSLDVISMVKDVLASNAADPRSTFAIP